MKAVFELDFDSPKMAKKAKELLEREDLDGKSSVTLETKGNLLVARIGAERFALLRARAMGLLRNAKLVYDSIDLVEGKTEE